MKIIDISQVVDGLRVEYQIAEHLEPLAYSLVEWMARRYQTRTKVEQEFLVVWGPLKMRTLTEGKVQILEYKMPDRIWQSDLTMTLTNLAGQQLLGKAFGLELMESFYNDWVTIHAQTSEARNILFERSRSTTSHHSGWLVTPVDFLSEGEYPSTSEYQARFAFDLACDLSPYLPQVLTLPYGSRFVLELDKRQIVYFREEGVECITLIEPEDVPFDQVPPWLFS